MMQHAYDRGLAMGQRIGRRARARRVAIPAFVLGVVVGAAGVLLAAGL